MYRVRLTHTHGCISKISKLIYSGDLNLAYNVPGWKRRTISFFFFKSLPLLAVVSPPPAGNIISYFCTPSFYLQICLLQLLRSLTLQYHLGEAIHW